MQIQLTQDEIKEAVRQYISKDFNLDGRNLSISFTATRVPTASIVANLVLTKDGAGDTTEIPGFTNATEEAVAEANAAPVVEATPAAAPEVKPASTKAKGTPAPVTTAALAATPVVAADTATAAAAEAKTEPAEAAVAEDAQVAGDAAEAAAAVVGEAPKTTTSLFG